MAAGPRVLVTGFEPFPGAPVNPTEWLVGRLRERPPAVDGIGEFRADMLPVAYEAVAARLSEIGRAFQPDVAVHFGLAQSCRGFRLERFARNRYAACRPDNSGFAPADGPICAGPETLTPSLPLDAIHKGLSAAGLPVEWLDDAGGYLCNVVFTLSLASGADGFCPAMSGFIHVPLITTGNRSHALLMHPFAEANLLAGAEIIVRACVDAFAAAK